MKEYAVGTLPELDTEKTCCFTGHRPHALSFGDESDAECLRIKKRLREEILRHVLLGADCFITGMALGVDTWAGEICADLRDNGIGLKLIAAVPCARQSAVWNEGDRKRYQLLLERCDAAVILSDEYTPWCMQKRDRYMVDNSKYVIGVYNGDYLGGTFYTLKYARKRGKDITLITTGTMLDTAGGTE